MDSNFYEKQFRQDLQDWQDIFSFLVISLKEMTKR